MTLKLEQIGVHNPQDIPKELPDRLILQLHWYCEPNFQSFLKREGFEILVLARHPLDVLLSVWHFVPRGPMTARWLEGNAEISPDLGTMPPTSPEFHAYATSWGAENLLSVSYQWWHQAGVVKAKYEDLVSSPAAGFGQMLSSLGAVSDVDSGALANALDIDWLGRFKNLPNQHGWQGTPGLWRRLIPMYLGRSIHKRHRRIFDILGYTVPFNLLTSAAAERNWRRLATSPAVQERARSPVSQSAG